MKILVNNQELEIQRNSSIYDLLSILKLEDPVKIAIAVNETVIPKTNWQNVFIKEGDKILLIRATSGG